jgi:hypothetical protein
MPGRSHIRTSGLRWWAEPPAQPGILADGATDIASRSGYARPTTRTLPAATSSSARTSERLPAGWNESIRSAARTAYLATVHHSTKEGICAKDGSSNGEVHGNEVHHTGAVGIYVDAQDKATRDIEVYGNVSRDGAEDGFAVASEVGGLLSNVKVYNNLAFRNGWVGIAVSDCCTASHPIAGVEIVNNTVYDNGRAGWGGGILIGNPQAAGVVVRNNITSQNRTFQSQEPRVQTAYTDHNDRCHRTNRDPGTAWPRATPPRRRRRPARFSPARCHRRGEL